MDLEKYNSEIFRLLGVRGPCGENATHEIWKLPDGSIKFLVPSHRLNEEQRVEQLLELRRHLGVIELKRKNGNCSPEH